MTTAALRASFVDAVRVAIERVQRGDHHGAATGLKGISRATIRAALAEHEMEAWERVDPYLNATIRRQQGVGAFSRELQIFLFELEESQP